MGCGMQINVSQLLQAPIGTTRNYPVNETVDIAGDGNARPVHGELRLLRTNRSILVAGTLHIGVELSCSRCLSPFTYPVTLKIEEEYIPAVDVLSGMPLPPPEELGSFSIDDHHVIDLIEAICQYALMTLPMKPLCRQDCGRNPNQGACDCPEQEIDPRWAELTKLL